MTKSNIHPTAIIEPGAQIGEGVTVEPYAVIKSTVTLENRVVIKAHTYIDGHTTIGEGTTILPIRQHRHQNARPQIPWRKDLCQNRQKLRDPRICDHQFVMPRK